MQRGDSVTSEFVRRVGGLDNQFTVEYSSNLTNADSYPYGVMAFFEVFLCQKCKASIDACEPLLRSAIDVIERGLTDNYDELQNMIEVAFVEKLFYDDNRLFKWMMDNAGSKLKY